MRVLLLYAAITAGLATTSPATIYVETGDAGDSPGTAQSAAGSGPLTSILGLIDSSADDDIYRIYISDPANFSASSNNAGTQLSVDDDTILFLFDEFGFGIIANDDDPEDLDSLKAALPAGSFSGPPGTYLLAISIFSNVPRNVFAEEIFPTLSSDDIAPAAGSGSERLIHNWTFDPNPVQTGPYRIDLTGAEFVVPEPGTASMMFIAVAVIAAARRRSRAK